MSLEPLLRSPAFVRNLETVLSLCLYRNTDIIISNARREPQLGLLSADLSVDSVCSVAAARIEIKCKHHGSAPRCIGSAFAVLHGGANNHDDATAEDSSGQLAPNMRQSELAVGLLSN